MKHIQSSTKIYSIQSYYIFNAVLICIQFNVKIYIQFNVEKCIQSGVEISSIAGQNIFNPMSIYSISMVASSQGHVVVRYRKRSPTFAKEERWRSPGTYEAL